MFITINDETGELVNAADVTHVSPQDDGGTGSYIFLRDDEMVPSPLSPTQLGQRLPK